MTTLEKFKCTACGKQYAWKQELSGKKVRCKCGSVVVVPKPPEPEVGDDPSLDDLYALSGEDRPQAVIAPNAIRCPSCQADVEPGNMICVSCGMNFATGKRVQTVVGAGGPARSVIGGAAAIAPGIGGARTLGYAGRKPVNNKEADDSRAEMMQYVPPAITAVIGIILTFVYVIGCLKLSVGVASVYVGISLAVNMVMISLGCLIAMKLFDFSLGAPALALLKICAVAMLPGAVSSMIEFYGGMMGGFVGWGVSLLMYYALLMWFFDLDGMEVVMVTSIIWFVRTWIGFAVVALLFSSIMGGGNFGGSGPMAMVMGGGTGARSVKTDDSPPGRINSRAEQLLMRRGNAEALEWVNAAENRIILNFDHAATVKAIEGLYEAGAEDVSVSDVNEAGQFLMADKLVVELPEDPAARKKVFAVHAALFENRDVVGAEDVGPDQVYMILDFDGNSDPLR